MKNRFGCLRVELIAYKLTAPARVEYFEPAFQAQERVTYMSLRSSERGKPQPGEVELHLPYVLFSQSDVVREICGAELLLR